MKNYNTIIFDFGGVLGSDANSWTNYEDVSILTGLSTQTIDTLFQKQWNTLKIGKTDLEQFFTAVQLVSKKPVSIEALRKAYHSKIFINEAVIKLVTQLQPHYHLYVLANESREGMQVKKQKFNLDNYFRNIFNSAELGLFKPDPKIFISVLEEIKDSPANTIFIDDQEKNVLAARELGITSFLYHDFSTLSKDLTQVLSTALGTKT